MVENQTFGAHVTKNNKVASFVIIYFLYSQCSTINLVTLYPPLCLPITISLKEIFIFFNALQDIQFIHEKPNYDFSFVFVYALGQSRKSKLCKFSFANNERSKQDLRAIIYVRIRTGNRRLEAINTTYLFFPMVYTTRIKV